MAVKLYADLQDFSLGINQKDGPTLIMDQELVDAENVVLGKGFAQKRNGFEKYSPQFTDPVYKLYDFKKSNGTREFLCVSGQILFKVIDETTFTAVGFSLSSNTTKLITYKNRSIQDSILIADGGKLKEYNGTSVAVVTPHTPSTDEETDPGLNDLDNLTNFRTIALKKDRVFAAAHPTVKNRVSFCYIDPYIGFAAYDYWPATYFFDVAVEDNDEIVELKVFRSVLLILCKKSVWALQGDGANLADLQLVKINVPNGCIAPGSVQEVGNNLFYLADDHVYSIFATEQEFISAQVVSDKVSPILKSITLADKAKATSIFYDNKYYLSFPSGVTLVYDAILESWSKFTNVKANSFLNRDGVLYFSSNDGYVYRFNEAKYSDDGQPINYFIKLRILDMGLPVNRKKFRRIWIVQKQYDDYTTTFKATALIDQSLFIDLTPDGTKIASNSMGIWDEGNWDEVIWDSQETIKSKIKIHGKGSDIQISISNNVLDEPLSIYSIVIEYEDKGPK
jgi:hypothetical protein